MPHFVTFTCNNNDCDGEVDIRPDLVESVAYSHDDRTNITMKSGKKHWVLHSQAEVRRMLRMERKTKSMIEAEIRESQRGPGAGLASCT